MFFKKNPTKPTPKNKKPTQESSREFSSSSVKGIKLIQNTLYSLGNHSSQDAHERRGAICSVYKSASKLSENVLILQQTK